MITPELEKFYASIQRSCLPGVWSRGVALARTKSVRLERRTDEELLLRVKVGDRAVSSKVSLWPADEDAFCDCEDRVEPCVHIAAAIAALKNDLQVTDETAPSTTVIRYQLRLEGKTVVLERLLGSELMRESLVSIVGGIGSGRIVRAQVDATQGDYAVDQALDGRYDGKLDRAAWTRLLPRLRTVAEIQAGGIRLDDRPIQIGTVFSGAHVEVKAEDKGLRLLLVEDRSVTEAFDQGVVLCGDSLRVLEEPRLTAEERQKLLPPGRFFKPSEVPQLMTEILPALEKKIEVLVLAEKIPEVTHDRPRIVLRLEATAETSTEAGTRSLNIVPAIEYPSEYAVKDLPAERELARKAQTEYHLSLGQPTRLRGEAAVAFVQKTAGDRDIEIRGSGARAFTLQDPLAARMALRDGDFDLRFESGSQTADAAQVLEAWARGESAVPLLGGGFAPLPGDWLARFGPQLQRLLALRGKNGGRLPQYARLELATLGADAGAELTPSLRAMSEKLTGTAALPEAKLPDDLQAELRRYQQEGVNWLRFLTDSGMGALLADDMGLGKTLQAICVIQGRTLIVAPTSVLSAWKEQLTKFRTSLSVNLYSGAQRKLDPKARVVLTSYGILRQEPGSFHAEIWDLAIVDEAQMIKNPESQVAQAVHGLRAKARITLSGTPVENRLEDLWSQFQFLNPGLLGSRSEFTAEFAEPIGRGEERASLRFRQRIKPFILRRLKSQVAPELPPRTEVVLHAELTREEQALYDAVLTTSRKEVMEKLEEGGSVFGALELLLRLRQACCHPALVPGQKSETSSKLELLAESLEASIAQGHRALVFSQWTGFLDLIEPRLRSMGVTYSRLDGSTPNRSEVVSGFQRPDGPSVLLISLKAGGTGLTLTAADHVYLMDSWWNPAVEDQAADRVHRIGQESPVLIHRLIAKDTIEDRIHALQNRKRQLAETVLEGGAASLSMSGEDILALIRD